MRRLSRELREQVTNRGGAPIVLLGETFTGADGHSEILEYVSEYELDGQFIDGEASGHGLLLLPTGERYEGGFEGGAEGGHPTMVAQE